MFFSVHDIALFLNLAHLRPAAERLPAIVHLVRAVLPIALVPVAPSARVRAAHLHVVGLPPLEALPRRHHAVAVVARHLTHHVTTNGTARIVEGATAVAHQPAEDVSAHHQLVDALPVGVLNRLVADAAQAHLVPEKIAHCPASGRLSVGNAASGIDARTGAEVGVQRMGGM